MTPINPDGGESMVERRHDRVELADAIVRSWEASTVPFDPAHQIQLALIAAKFLIEIADSPDAALSDHPTPTKGASE